MSTESNNADESPVDASSTDQTESASTNNRSPDESPSHYIGIGASAGGLEALKEFFDSMDSMSNAAFIVVQHLSPDFKSLMDKLLRKHTQMSVENVVDGVRVQPNSIYLIPPKQNMVLSKGCLFLSEQQRKSGVNLPIDIFLKSLAHSVEDRAIGVILSGTGSDGSRGIRAIKAGGGLVLVQDMDSAKFDGMPYSAAQTGMADFVMNPAGIASYIKRYLDHPLLNEEGRSAVNDLTSNESALSLIFTLLRKESGIDFSYYKSSTVARRIERRMGINQIIKQQDYLSLLQSSKTESQSLARELLINVTRFFRDDEAFQALVNKVVKPLVEKVKSNEEIRIWIAGCATGEEAYSIAILFDEALRQHSKNARVKVFATDVDTSAISVASAARYPLDIAQHINPDRLKRYFVAAESEYELRSDIRKMVVFATHNMISDPPFSNIDLICCRNALIYFQQPIQRKVIAGFHFSLKQNASMFLGLSESIGELKTHFEPVVERLRIYRKVANSRIPMTSMVRPTDVKSKLSMPPVSNLLRSYRAHTVEARFEHVKDRLINDFVPSCLILNEAHQAMHVYGDANKYLTRFPVGRVSTNVHDLIVDELSIALDTSLARAKNEGKPVYYTNIQATIGGEVLLINLQAEYFPEHNTTESYYTVVLSDANSVGTTNRSMEAYDVAEQTRQRIRDLENELLHKQEHLQVTNEELETTNEELQSTNEELMSSNEELQSTNEELQSVNEELFTVNSEYQEKINELMIANDDLDNVLSSTAIGLIFLDDNQLIRKYTAVAESFFSLLPSDVGRPLRDITNDLEYARLFEDVDMVCSSNKPLHREVYTSNGGLVHLKLLPYRSSMVDGDTEKTGSIITVSDREQPLELMSQRLSSEKRVSGIADIEGATLSDDVELLHVLVVDDSSSDRKLIKRFLGKVSWDKVRLHEAQTITEGIEILMAVQVDVCLVDYRLGPDTAVEFLNQLAARKLDLPIIMMSGYTREELAEEMPNSGFTHFINKEDLSSTRLLETTLRNALGSHNSAEPGAAHEPDNDSVATPVSVT